MIVLKSQCGLLHLPLCSACKPAHYGCMDISRAQELLNVDPGTVSPRELRRAYHEQLRLHHPDLAQAGEETAARNEYTARLASAFRVLEIYLEEREKTAPPPPQNGLGDWSFSAEQPDWWPSEPPPGGGPGRVPPSKRNPKKSKPTQRATLWPSVSRQRAVVLLVGVIALLTGSQWYDSVGFMLTAVILGSILIGRPLEVINDVLNPVERWLNKRK